MISAIDGVDRLPNQELADVELMTDQEALADLSNIFREQGGMMVCHGCDDVSEVIAGIVIVKETEEAWVLCGPCLRQLPLHGPLAS
jgi:hypothetical protein